LQNSTGITSSGGERFALELTSQLDAARRVRRALEEQFGPQFSADFIEDLGAVLTELVNNSVLYGPGTPIKVRLVAQPDGLVRGEVEDDGDGEVAIREIARPDEGGFGLRLVDALVDRGGVYEASTHVWFEFSSD
jgi:two-component sensor histidine kinase